MLQMGHYSVDKHYQITKGLLDHYGFEQSLDMPFVEYSRYILSHGTESERTIYANGFLTKLLVDHGTLRMGSR